MPLMLDVSDEVRAEIGDDEVNRLLSGENAPDTYDCTSCRTRGDIAREHTSTVLFVGQESAVLAFAHAGCAPSQVIQVSEEQLREALRTISQTEVPQVSPAPAPAPAPAYQMDSTPAFQGLEPERPAAILGITCGQVLCQGIGYPALVVEPTGPIARPGSDGTQDEFLPLLVEQGFTPVGDLEQLPPALAGWSVLLAAGQLHAVLQPTADGGQVAWWQAHQPLHVSDGWRSAAVRYNRVLVYAAPATAIGRQPREDLMREALEKAAASSLLVAATLPLSGT